MPFSGSLSNKISKKLSGVLGNLSGTVGKKSPQALSGTLGTLSGSLSAQRVDRGDVSGVFENLSGTLATNVTYAIALSGNFSATGAVAKHTAISVSGAWDFIDGGSLNAGYKYFQTLSGTLGSSGSLSTKYSERKESPAGFLGAGVGVRLN